MEQNAFNEFVISLMTASFMSNAVEVVIDRVVIIALVMGGAFYFINLGWNYITHSINSLSGKKSEGFFSIGELIRTIVLLLCIFFYPTIAQVISGGVDFLNSFTAPASKQSEWLDEQTVKYKQQADFNLEKIKKEALKDVLTDPNKTSEEKAFAQKQLDEMEAELDSQSEDDGGGGFFDNWFEKIEIYLSNLPVLLLHGITAVILAIVRIIVIFMAAVVFKLMLILGPLAFAFSILPPFKDKIDEWFGTLLGVGLVFTTINLFDHLVYEIFYQMSVFPGIGGNYAFSMLGFDIVIIVCYLLCFWFTSKWVGKGDAGRVLSKAVALTTMAVGAGLAGAGIAVGGAGGGSGTVGNVASAAKDAIKDD